MRPALLPAAGALLAAGSLLVAADAVADQPLKVTTRLLAGPLAAELGAPLLAAWDKPVGDGFTLCTTRVATKVDDKGRLEADVEGKGTFRPVPAKGGLVTVKVERIRGGKPVTATLPVRFSRGEDGTWRWRDAA